MKKNAQSILVEVLVWKPARFLLAFLFVGVVLNAEAGIPFTSETEPKGSE